MRSSVFDWLSWCLGFGLRLLDFLGFLGLLLSLSLVGLLLLGDILLLGLSLVTLLALFAFLALLLFISVLSVLLWSSWLEVLLIVVVLVASILIALRSWNVVVLHLVLIHLLDLHLWSLGNEHLWLRGIEIEALKLSLHGNWSWAQVLVWIETTESSHLGKACDLDERWWLWIQWAELEWAD